MNTLLVGLGIGVLMAALAGCEDDPRDLDYLKDAGVKQFDAGHSGGSGGSSAGSGGSGGSGADQDAG